MKKTKRNWWKVITIILMIIVIAVVALKGIDYILSHIPSVPDDYTKKVQTGGDIEAKYLDLGSHDVEYYETEVMMSFQKFELYYPKDIKNMDKIGITGHSQGGLGVINAITEQKHSDIYKAAVILSSTETNIAKAFMWETDSTKIHTNTLMITSTGQTDSNIAPLENIQKTYNNITDDVTKVIARRNDCDHGEMLYYADGYVTTWFMYYLQGDSEAKKAFFGNNAEINSNPLYQDVQVHQRKL